MEDIARQAIHYYDTNNQKELLALANRVWRTDLDGQIPDGTADVYYFASIIVYRNRKDPSASAFAPANHDAAIERELWRARAMTAAVLTGARHTTARLLLERVFNLMELEAYPEARSVLGEMLRLVGPKHELHPFFMRLHEEKSAYSFFAEGRYGDAVDRYTSALRFCEKDPRGALKVRGGLVLSRYLDQSEAAGEQDDLLDAMRQVRDDAASAGYKDVANDASCNLEMMEAGEYEGWCPFELV